MAGYTVIYDANVLVPATLRDAALRFKAQAIVTCNIRDFPRAPLEALSIEVLDPDEFVTNLVERAPLRI